VDGRVLVFTAVVALVAGIATGLVPAAQALGADFTHWLRSGSRAGDDRSAALRMPLLVLQAGLTFVLLTGTALFVTSLRRVHAVPLGLDADRVLSVLVNTAGRSYSEDERASMYDRLLATALETPGIAHGALGTTMPFRSASALAVFIPGRDSVPLTSAGGPYINVVSSRFFETMGTRMIDGRGFRATDRAGSPPVVVVNDVAAKMWWPGERAVGKCIKLDADTMPCAEVVGVATTVHRFSIVEDASAQLYAPLGQVPSQGSAGVLFVRPHGDARSAIAPLQRRLQTSIAGLPYVSVEPMSDVIAPRLQSWRMGATMFGVFGVLALVLATIGLYSVLAYDVAQRTGELGVRVALGAMTLDIVRLVVGRGVRVVLVGVAIGVLVTLVAARFVAPLLFHTSPRDPLILTGVGLTLLAVSLAATWIPARRAAGVDPASALREA
jgi:predicted permease